MNRYKRNISLFLSSVLFSGLLLSTIHVHELPAEISDTPSTDVHYFSQDHNLCPLCAVVYRTVEIDTDTLFYPPEQHDILVVPESNKLVQSPLLLRGARSPPFFV